MHDEIATPAGRFDMAVAPPPSPILEETVRQPLPPYLVRLVHLMDRIERRESEPCPPPRPPLSVSPGP